MGRSTYRHLSQLMAALWLGIVLGGHPASAAEFTVDCARTIGRIRALHGGNDGPLQGGGLVDLSAYHRELRIPHTRLHDCHWPNADVVDMHVVFPNSKADPELPESYDFARTDPFITATVKTGAQIVYRLGESIEHEPVKRFVHPPADARRWAAACVGVIRHYNEGWAGGARHGIRYWEIWNEPENRPAMWSGSDEDYLRLYETAAKAIKSRWPELKVGGPSFGYSGRLVDGRFEPSEFMVKFLERCQSRSLPLDFFSWHLYTADPRECVARARGIREALDRQGFKQTESHLNEWNYLPDNDWSAFTLKGQGLPRERFCERVGNAEGAAFSAAVLLNLQDAPVDAACYFSANTQGFGLFSTHGTPRKVYHAFNAFRTLLETPVRLEAGGSAAACAGRNEPNTRIGIMLSLTGAAEEPVRVALRNLPWDGTAKILAVDAGRDLAPAGEQAVRAGQAIVTFTVKTPAVCLVMVTPAGRE